MSSERIFLRFENKIRCLGVFATHSLLISGEQSIGKTTRFLRFSDFVIGFCYFRTIHSIAFQIEEME